MRFPDGYAVHPRTWDAVHEALSGRLPVMAASGQRLSVIFSASGDELVEALRDGGQASAGLLNLLGLTFEHVEVGTVRPVSSRAEILAQLDSLTSTEGQVFWLNQPR